MRFVVARVLHERIQTSRDPKRSHCQREASEMFASRDHGLAAPSVTVYESLIVARAAITRRAGASVVGSDWVRVLAV